MPHLDVISETKGGARTREGAGWLSSQDPREGQTTGPGWLEPLLCPQEPPGDKGTHYQKQAPDGHSGHG